MFVNAQDIRGVLTDIVQDLLLQNDSWVHRVFTRVPANKIGSNMSGTFYVRPLGAMLGRGRRPEGLERGEEAEEGTDRGIEVNYRCKRRTGFGTLADEDRADIEASGMSDDALRDLATQGYSEVMSALGLYGASILFDESFWGEYDLTVDGSGSWVDPANANPTRDLRLLKTKIVPGANAIVIPEEDAIALAETAAILGNSVVNGRIAGSVPLPAIVQWLKGTIGFDHVEIVSDLYNDADYHVEDNIVPVVEPGKLWVGYKGGLHDIHPETASQDQTEFDRNIRKAMSSLAYHSYDDLVADQSAKGIVVTNTLTVPTP